MASEHTHVWLGFRTGAIKLVDLSQIGQIRVDRAHPNDEFRLPVTVMVASRQLCWAASPTSLGVWLAAPPTATTIVETTHALGYLRVKVATRFSLVGSFKECWFELENGRLSWFKDDIQGSPLFSFEVQAIDNLKLVEEAEPSLLFNVETPRGLLKIALKESASSRESSRSIKDWHALLERVRVAQGGLRAGASERQHLVHLPKRPLTTRPLQLTLCHQSGRVWSLHAGNHLVEWTIECPSDLTGLRQDLQKIVGTRKLVPPALTTDIQLCSIHSEAHWWLASRKALLLYRATAHPTAVTTVQSEGAIEQLLSMPRFQLVATALQTPEVIHLWHAKRGTLCGELRPNPPESLQQLTCMALVNDELWACAGRQILRWNVPSQLPLPTLHDSQISSAVGIACSLPFNDTSARVRTVCLLGETSNSFDIRIWTMMVTRQP